jgi:peptidoglycan/LPS O-acetylase OafA/YrhL
MSAAIEPELAIQSPASSTPHLAFLDGLRGLSALWVVFFHVAGLIELRYGQHYPAAVNALAGWMFYGDRAVSIFIVLSGYCLMMPVVASSQKRLKGGVKGYLIRRARRIFPPYYGALALSLLFYALWNAVKQRAHLGSGSWGEYAFDPQNIALHVLMLHDLSSQWIGAINPPMWSVAVEWHLYFFLPLLLLPLLRRAGLLSMLFAAIILGLVPHFLLGPSVNLDWAHPWLLVLFAFGMAGAALAPDVNSPESPVGRFPLLPTAVIASVLFVAARAKTPKGAWLEDIFVGIAATALILWLQRQHNANEDRKNAVRKWLESRPAIVLGRFSYSIYLIHFLIVWAIPPVAHSLHLSITAALFFGIFCGIPLVLAIAYAFYLALERPFTSVRQ